MRLRDVEISDRAFADAEKLEMRGNVEKRLRKMAEFSAPFTHPLGNRRYESYVLEITDGRLIGIDKFDPNEPIPRRAEARKRPRFSRIDREPVR